MHYKGITWLHTHDRKPGSVALARLAAVLMSGDAPVGGEGVLLLNVRDVERSEGGQRKPVTCGRHTVRINVPVEAQG